jgi:hypothetical protein
MPTNSITRLQSLALQLSQPPVVSGSIPEDLLQPITDFGAESLLRLGIALKWYSHKLKIKDINNFRKSLALATLTVDAIAAKMVMLQLPEFHAHHKQLKVELDDIVSKKSESKTRASFWPLLEDPFKEKFIDDSLHHLDVMLRIEHYECQKQIKIFADVWHLLNMQQQNKIANFLLRNFDYIFGEKSTYLLHSLIAYLFSIFYIELDNNTQIPSNTWWGLSFLQSSREKLFVKLLYPFQGRFGSFTGFVFCCSHFKTIVTNFNSEQREQLKNIIMRKITVEKDDFSQEYYPKALTLLEKFSENPQIREEAPLFWFDPETEFVELQKKTNISTKEQFAVDAINNLIEHESLLPTFNDENSHLKPPSAGTEMSLIFPPPKNGTPSL